jgi:apolipoprotein N-acyltransferase
MRSFFLCLFSALLLILSFPKPDLGCFAWLAFLPLFIALDRKNLKQIVIFSCLTGWLFFLGTIYWVGYVSLWGLVTLVLYLTVYFALFGVCLALVRDKTEGLLLIPAFWVSLEYIRSYLFTGFGWVTLGYSQYLNISLIQIASITGVYGISFLVMMVNVVIFQTLQVAGHRLQAVRPGLKPVLINLSVVLLILISVFSYGKFQLLKRPGEKIRVAIIQGNISQEEKWNPELSHLILNKYRALTRLASFDQPEIIIWPETAVPGYLVNQKEILDYVEGLAREVNSPLLVGSPFWVSNREVYNSSFLISSQGKVISRYDKLHLVPFGEYIPLKSIFWFVKKIDKRAGGGQFSPGKEYMIFKIPAAKGQELRAKFGVLICFEDIFPNLTRKFVNQGADFMVNITNDAWFGRSGGPYQHAQASVLRAVENRRGMVRSANTGVSCFIEPSGRIIDRVSDNQGGSLFVTGYLTKDLRLSKSYTFYTRFGDLFAYLCILISIGWVVLLLLDKISDISYNKRSKR